MLRTANEGEFNVLVKDYSDVDKSLSNWEL